MKTIFLDLLKFHFYDAILLGYVFKNVFVSDLVEVILLLMNLPWENLMCICVVH